MGKEEALIYASPILRHNRGVNDERALVLLDRRQRCAGRSFLLSRLKIKIEA
jgi:hypothetical protein